MKASPMFLLFVVFMVLRLTDVVDWSWWWVTAPLWGGFLLLLPFEIAKYREQERLKEQRAMFDRGEWRNLR